MADLKGTSEAIVVCTDMPLLFDLIRILDYSQLLNLQSKQENDII